MFLKCLDSSERCVCACAGMCECACARQKRNRMWNRKERKEIDPAKGSKQEEQREESEIQKEKRRGEA